MTQDADIFISGGGVAGLTAAAALGAAGFSVVVADPAPPVITDAADGADLRTTAFLQPARHLLEAAGIWEHYAPHATPLRVMRIVDAGGTEPVARSTRDFDSADMGDAPFGWNLPNWLLRRELLRRIAELDTVDFRSGTGFSAMLGRESGALVTLTDGSRLRARLVIGADGRDSPVRQAAGIGARTWRYGQKALTFSVTHPAPHDNVSTEIHRTGGPFTLVPLPDQDGHPCSAVVWMVPGAEAQRLMSLDADTFAAEATTRSACLFGTLRLASRRLSWPIISRLADRMSARRTALMAEAAHVVPPIGAQGLNMSLADLGTLLELARKTPDRLGAPEMLDAYHRRRHPEVRMRVEGVNLLNRASMAETGMVRDLRALGIRALHDVAPVRRGLMRLGLGARA
jgi:2-octaprenyl-6-methoxyphenol hydroxylase